LRFTGDMLASLQFDDANPQGGANDDRQAGSIGVQHTPVVTGSRSVVRNSPGFAYAHRFQSRPG
jgi:hypothetical protein